MQLLFVFLTLFVCCAYSQTWVTGKLAGNALVQFKNYKSVCNQVSGSVGVDAAIAAKVSALKAVVATDAALKAYLLTALNVKASVSAAAFVAAKANAQVELDAAAAFVASVGSVKALAIDANADVVATAGVVLDKVQARAAVLLRLKAAAELEVDLVTKQLFALLCQEVQLFIDAQAKVNAAVFAALNAKIVAGTAVVAEDITAEILVALAANVDLADLFCHTYATVDVLVGVKAKVVDLTKALVVDATLKAKAGVVTAVEAVADLKVKARAFFAAKVCKTVHVFGDLLAVFGAEVDAAVRLTLVARLRDLCMDELDLAGGITGIVITPIKATASVELALTLGAAAAVDVQAKLKALVLGFIHAHCHPFKVVVKSQTELALTVEIFASAAVNGDPIALTTDNVEVAAQTKFKADVVAGVEAAVDADFVAVLKTKAGISLGGLLTTLDTALTTVGQAIVALDVSVKAALTATLDAFAGVKIDLLDTALVNFKTEVFAVADLQARVKIANAQISAAYNVLLLRLKQDVLDIQAAGKLVVRLEATIKKQLLQALVDRNGIAGSIGCTALNTFDVEADFDELTIEALVKSNAQCAQYAPNFVKILSLKRLFLQATVAVKAQVDLEASVKASVALATTKFTELKAKVDARIAAAVNVKLNAAALVGVWVNAAVEYKTCVKGCLGVLGRGAFGASIEVDVAAAVGTTIKHTATCSAIDLAASASVKADLELKLAAYLPICIAQCTGGDASYCKQKPTVEPTKKRADTISASQVTNTEDSSTTDSAVGTTSTTGSQAVGTSGSATVVLSLSLLLGAIAHYFM